MTLCILVCIPGGFGQVAHGQSLPRSPLAVVFEPMGTDPKPPVAPNAPAPAATIRDGVALKPSDCVSSGKWLAWAQYRPLAMGAGIVFTALVILLLTWGSPSRLLLGQDNRFSNSKCQMALWFFIVVSAYITVFLVRLKSCAVGGIGIPSNLLIMSGLSAVTFAGAKAITTSKVNNMMAMGHPNPKPPAPPDIAIAPPVALAAVAAVDGAEVDGAQPEVVAVAVLARPVVAGFRSLKNLVGDLTSNDGLKVPGVAGAPATVSAPTLDLGDTQMIVITILAVLTYLVTMYTYLGSTNFSLTAGVNLPDVDNTLLSLFGLGQGAYLSKKAVGNAGES